MSFGGGWRGRTAAAAGGLLVVALLAGCAASNGADPLTLNSTAGAPSPAASTTPRQPSAPKLSAPVAAEMRYVNKYWWSRNSTKYGDLRGTDCVNFTSQALTARGWAQTAGWNHSLTGGQNSYSPAWISSTAFMRYLGEHPELATAVSDTQRSTLRVGDIAQFDWDNSGDRDHTAIITRITRSGSNIRIYVAAHDGVKTVGYEYRSVDWMLGRAHRDPHVYYWHLKS